MFNNSKEHFMKAEVFSTKQAGTRTVWSHSSASSTLFSKQGANCLLASIPQLRLYSVKHSKRSDLIKCFLLWKCWRIPGDINGLTILKGIQPYLISSNNLQEGYLANRITVGLLTLLSFLKIRQLKVLTVPCNKNLKFLYTVDNLLLYILYA